MTLVKYKFLIIYLFWVSIFHVIICTETKNKKEKNLYAEKSLIQKLFLDYDKHTRPVSDHLSPKIMYLNNTILQILVEFGLSLIQILELNEMEQVLTTSVKTLYKWKDYNLMWNPNEFENITEIHIPISMLWIPDISIYNYADERLEERKTCNAIVSYSGMVKWHPMAIFKSTCPVETKNFPYDFQVCQLKFGPWSYDGFRVNMTFYDSNNFLQMNEFINSAEWKFLNSTAIYTSITYPCCNEPFVDISFYILLEKNTAFHNYLILTPCLLLSFITAGIYLIPLHSPIKLLIGVNILTAYTLQLLILKKTTPVATSSYPILTTYYCVNITLLTATIYLTIFVVNANRFSLLRKPVPWWLKKAIFKRIARLFFINTKIKYQSWSIDNSEINRLNYLNLKCKNRLLYTKNSYDKRLDLLYFQIYDIYENTIVREKIKLNDSKIYDEEWYLMAMIVDRILLCAYVLLLLTAIFFFFPLFSVRKPPDNWFKKN